MGRRSQADARHGSKALLAEDLESATNAQLAAHMRRAAAFLDSAVYFHHRFNVTVMVPLGDFLVQAGEWTGLSATELLHPMRGLSPVSAGGREELQAVRSAIQSDAAAMRILMSDRPPADAASRTRWRTRVLSVWRRGIRGGCGLARDGRVRRC